MKSLDDVIRELDSDGYFDFKKLMKYAPEQRLWMIIGARRIGKTLTSLHLACKAYLDAGVKTMWIRNYKAHMERPQFYLGFLNGAKSRGWCPETWECKPDGVWDGDEQVVMFSGLNTFSETRGNEYDQRLMIVDEFIDEQRKYPKECVKGLLSLTQTVFAGDKDARLIMTSNFVSCANPYFVGLRLYPDKKYDVTVFKDKSCAVEVCRGYKQAPINESEWGKLYASAGYSDYADDTEDRLFELVQKSMKGGKRVNCCLVTSSGYYMPWQIGDIFYWKEYMPQPNEKVNKFTKETFLMSKDVVDIKYCKQFLDDGVKGNRFRYASPNVMYEVMSHVVSQV